MALTSEKIPVVVAVIINHEQQILIAKRPEGKHLSGLWEFPGGKVEAGETATQALAREVKEEVGLVIDNPESLVKVDYCYAEKAVALDVYLVKQFSGIATGLEQQQIKWVKVSELQNYQFPEANQAIIAALIA
jgi:8-oxo-dGTP diphosphatase